jgi:hypothetical protein
MLIFEKIMGQGSSAVRYNNCTETLAAVVIHLCRHNGWELFLQDAENGFEWIDHKMH